MRRLTLSAILLATFISGGAEVKGTITLTGIPFADNAFADQVLAVNGQWDADVARAVLGPNIYYCVTNWPYDEGAYIDVAFTDNVVANGDGSDLVIFEDSGVDPGCPARITIAAVTKTYPTPWREGLVNAAIIDLGDFGVPYGGSITQIRLWGGTNDTDYMGMGALHPECTVPAPAAAILATIGAGLVGWLRRRTAL